MKKTGAERDARRRRTQRPIVELIAIDASENVVRFRFRVSPTLRKLLWPSRELVMYCSEGVAGDRTVLRTAFLVAMAPLRWMCGAHIELGGPIDRAAVRSLRSTSAYLARHYRWPLRDLTAGQSSERVAGRPSSKDEALMFSGGVDSMMTLAQYRSRIRVLIHLSNFENLDGATTPSQRTDALVQTHKVAKAYGKRWMHLWTNIPSVFKHTLFDGHFPGECSFWLGLEHVQHIAAALCVTPVRMSRVLLSGGFNDLVRRAGSCAADADFVHTYQWPHPVQLTHEKLMRQKKVEYLLTNAPELLRQLRVCYSSGDGTCPNCRKCQATFLMVLSAGGTFRHTNFPRSILAAVEAKAREVAEVSADRHRFYNEATTGRALSGSRAERWAELIRLIERERAGEYATSPKDELAPRRPSRSRTRANVAPTGCV